MNLSRRALIVGGALVLFGPRPAGAVPVRVGALTFVPPEGVTEHLAPGGSSWDWWGRRGSPGLADLAVRTDLPPVSAAELLVLGLSPGHLGLVPGFDVEAVREVEVDSARHALLATVQVAARAGGQPLRGAVLALAGKRQGSVMWLVGSEVSVAMVTTLVGSMRVGAT